MKTIIAYHKFCRDGWTAALVSFRSICDNVVFLPLLPDEVNKAVTRMLSENASTHVRFFDLAINKNDVDRLFNHFDDCYVADHHKTTAESFSEMFDEIPIPSKFKYINNGNRFVFDNNKCGAMLAWDYYFPESDVPELIKYIQDRDLWTWTLENSKIVNAGLYELLTTPYVNRNELDNSKIWCGSVNRPGFLDPTNKVPDFSDWLKFLESDEWLSEALMVGKTIKSIQNREISKIMHGAKVLTWNGAKVYFVNSNVHTSDLGESLYSLRDESGELMCDYVFIWRHDQSTNSCYVSLRSLNGTDNDVSVIASQNGGGGHKHASGFTCNLQDLMVILSEAN